MCKQPISGARNVRQAKQEAKCVLRNFARRLIHSANSQSNDSARKRTNHGVRNANNAPKLTRSIHSISHYARLIPPPGTASFIRSLVTAHDGKHEGVCRPPPQPQGPPAQHSALLLLDLCHGWEDRSCMSAPLSCPPHVRVCVKEVLFKSMSPAEKDQITNAINAGTQVRVCVSLAVTKHLFMSGSCDTS